MRALSKILLVLTLTILSAPAGARETRWGKAFAALAETAALSAVIEETPGNARLPGALGLKGSGTLTARKPLSLGILPARGSAAVEALRSAIEAMRASPGPNPGGVSSAARDIGAQAHDAMRAAVGAANAAANAYRNQVRRGVDHPAIGRRGPKKEESSELRIVPGR